MTRQITFIIYFIGTLFITSCSDSKSRGQRTNDIAPSTLDIVDENISRTMDTVTEYIPQKYEESIIDSLLDIDINFRVIIKKSTLMDKFVIQTFEQGDNVKKIVYRDRKINIKVTVGEQTIFDKTLTKETFPQIGDKDFLNQAIMHGIWIEKYDKEEQCLTMSCNVIVPDTDWSYFFLINVDTKGKNEILLESIN